MSRQSEIVDVRRAAEDRRVWTDLESEDDELPCLPRLRPERDADEYATKIWKQLEYAGRNRLTRYVSQHVISFMEHLAMTVGRANERFRNRLIKMGGSYEGTKIDDPNEFDFVSN